MDEDGFWALIDAVPEAGRAGGRIAAVLAPRPAVTCPGASRTRHPVVVALPAGPPQIEVASRSSG